MAGILIFLGVLIFCAHLFAVLFNKKRIPDVLLLITIGIIIGPVCGFVHPADLGGVASIFSSLTLIFILLDSGIVLSIDSLRRYWRSVVQVTLLGFILSMVVAATACYFMGFHVTEALLVGSMVAGTGASIVLPLVRQMRVSEYTRTVLTMESSVSAVISIVVALSLMNSYTMGAVNVGSMIGKLLASLIMALLLGVLGGVIWSSLLDHVRKMQNSMFLTPAFVFVLFGITELLNFSGAIAVLMFGLVLGNPDYFRFSFIDKMQRHHLRPLQDNEKSFFKELVFIFKTYFFVYIGICIPFTNSVALVHGAIITAALFLIRFLLLQVVGRENTRNDRRVVSMMIPKGLSAALLASMPEQINQAAGAEVIPSAMMVKHLVYSIIFFSIIFTSLLVIVSHKDLVMPQPEGKEGPNDTSPASHAEMADFNGKNISTNERI